MLPLTLALLFLRNIEVDEPNSTGEQIPRYNLFENETGAATQIDNNLWGCGKEGCFDLVEKRCGYLRVRKITPKDGANWTSQKLPVDDVELWKVSFVGAHR